MNINTVKIQQSSYLVNGNIFVPKDEQNMDYRLVKEWLKYNTPEPEFSENVVPTKITRLQAKLQLLEIGLLDEVEEMVKQDRRVELYWSDVQSIERNHPILNQMATSLGLSSEQLDNLFIEASKLS